MRFVYFTHSLTSCWNHGNAHFLRGVLRDLLARGHEIRSFEPRDAWSSTNLRQDQGEGALQRFSRGYPDLAPFAGYLQQDIDAMLEGADVVLVHEWNDPALITALGTRRKQGGRFLLLFHDTHHRAVSDPEAIHRLDLSGYDGVLAFGAALAAVYERSGWSNRVFVWHEAADIRQFRPLPQSGARKGIVWIGNWGDEERTEELRRFLLEPAASLGIPLDIYGVRYPAHALALLSASGAAYRGWLANAEVPAVFARHQMTVHVPRRFYVRQLPGIPTIRMFEALACGIPLIAAPWQDSESLFREGIDYLQAQDPAQMQYQMRAVQMDAALRQSLVSHGLETIRSRHTCSHRVGQLLEIVAQFGAGQHASAGHGPTRETAAA